MKEVVPYKKCRAKDRNPANRKIRKKWYVMKMKMKEKLKRLALVCIVIFLCNIEINAECRVIEPEIPNIDNVWEYCDLSISEGPGYLYFENAGEGGYHITLENLVAYAVVDYAKKAGMSEEEWSLNRIIYRDNHYHAFVKSKSGNHIYFLIDGDWDANKRYIVMADIRKDGNAEIELRNGYAYNSRLTWHSYKEYYDGIREPVMDYKIDGGSGMSGGGMFDSMYEYSSTYAMYAYLDSVKEKRCQWEIDRNSAYMGSGFIADVSFTSGSKRVSMLIDVSNATYAVLDESITSDAVGNYDKLQYGCCHPAVSQYTDGELEWNWVVKPGEYEECLFLGEGDSLIIRGIVF